MQVDEEVARYFPAAQIDELPDDLSRPRHNLSVTSAAQRRKNYENCVANTKIWNAADTDAGRRAALAAYKARNDADQDAFVVMERFLQRDFGRLPPTEIEYAMEQLGLADEHNGVLSEEEKDSLDSRACGAGYRVGGWISGSKSAPKKTVLRARPKRILVDGSYWPTRA